MSNAPNVRQVEDSVCETFGELIVGDYEEAR
jgi:hypothetical protein